MAIKIIFLGDFNGGLEDASIKNLCLAYSLISMIHKLACYKNLEKLNKANCRRSFQKSYVIETSLSGFHKMVTTVMKTTFRKMEPKVVRYRDYNFFCNDSFRESLQNIVSQNLKSNRDKHYRNFVIYCKNVLDEIAPWKRSM